MDPRESAARIEPRATQAEHGEGELFDPKGHRPTGRRVVWVGAGVALCFAVLLGVGIVPRLLHRAAMVEDENKASSEVPRLRVARATRAAASAGLALPGSVEPFQETSVYARANGYVRKWRVDIGARVKKNDVLAELDLPDIDEELGQAQASAAQANAGIAQAKAQLELARATDQRYQALRPSGVVSQQEVDQSHASHDAQQANLMAAEAAHASAEANVRRLSDLKNFGTLVAPFDGVVTLRSAEIGQLVSSGMAGQPLFKVAEVDVVRVFVRVPQLYAQGIRVGMDAPTEIREMPGHVFPGKVARTANELDIATRTLRTEIDIPNAEGSLIAGMYAEVSFDVKRQDQPIYVPSTAVLFNASGTRAAVVRESAVHWVKVDIVADLGDRLAIGTGLGEGDVIAVNPSDKLEEGMSVQPEEIKGEAPAKVPAMTASATPPEVPKRP
jgi:membrane fusion protein, multidrug efflux system